MYKFFIQIIVINHKLHTIYYLYRVHSITYLNILCFLYPFILFFYLFFFIFISCLPQSTIFQLCLLSITHIHTHMFMQVIQWCQCRHIRKTKALIKINLSQVKYNDRNNFKSRNLFITKYTFKFTTHTHACICKSNELSVRTYEITLKYTQNKKKIKLKFMATNSLIGVGLKKRY